MLQYCAATCHDCAAAIWCMLEYFLDVEKVRSVWNVREFAQALAAI